MFKNTILPACFVSFILLLAGCKKEKYTFGELKAPSDLALNVSVVGANTANPNGDGSGNVTITTTSKDALTYKITFGDGDSLVTSNGSFTCKYKTPGTDNYTITVNAIGTGGATSTISKTVRVFVNFEIPAALTAALTNGSSRVWVTDKAAVGHFGVGPADGFFPIWYEAPPNAREAEAYDDEITFAVTPNNRITMSVNNKGQSFSIGAATGFYGFSGGDGAYAINTGGTKTLTFMASTTGSNAAQSSGIQFSVPGNGIINFGTGGTMYEIISYAPTKLFLRNIGADGNAWYQRLVVK